MVTLVSALTDGLAALAGLIGTANKNIAWQRVAVDCGDVVYIQETKNNEWRIRRIDTDGNVTIAVDAAITIDAAWTGRATLIYS